MEVVENHVHIYLEAPPRYSLAEVAHIMKSLSGREISKKFPKIRKQLWAEEYFVRSGGDKVTSDIIMK